MTCALAYNASSEQHQHPTCLSDADPALLEGLPLARVPAAADVSPPLRLASCVPELLEGDEPVVLNGLEIDRQ